MLLAIDVGNTETVFGVWKGHLPEAESKGSRLTRSIGVPPTTDPTSSSRFIGETPMLRPSFSPNGEWQAIWRRATNPDETEDQLAVWLKGVHELSGLTLDIDAVAVASVVPQMDAHLSALGRKWLKVEPVFIRSGAEVGLKVD